MRRELRITSEEGAKSRSFSAQLIGEVFANGLISSASNTRRPVWMMCVASHAESPPFSMNLKLGHKAEIVKTHGKGDRYELLRTTGYAIAHQKLASGTVTTAYVPDLFQVDPGMVDPDGAKFVLLAERRWLARSNPTAALCQLARELGVITDALTADLVMLAPLFCAYLDRRTRAPLVPDPAFQFRVLVACLVEGAASLPMSRHSTKYDRGWGRSGAFGLSCEGIEDLGLLPPIAFSAKHDALEALLAEQATLHFAGRRAA